MALIGGGGAGNVAGGANPGGIGNSIHYIGNHAYAYSGDIQSKTTGGPDTLMLSFNTQNQYIIGVLSFTEEAIAADNIFFRVFMNSESVINVKYDSSPNYDNTEYRILIPPQTKVEVKWGCSTDDEIGTAWFEGRVYG